MNEIRLSPLDGSHRELGARLVPFGGWAMPLAYRDGTLDEHRRCRRRAVVFDVSHLGTVSVVGPGALDQLQGAFTNDLRRIEPGRAQYTHLCGHDGSVLDDIIVWWLGAEQFHVMPNASNTDRVQAALTGHDTAVSDVTSDRAILAVQGPAARALLAPVSEEAAAVGRFRVTPFEWQGHVCIAAGTGYTGEDGVECSVPLAIAERFWEAVVHAGIPPAGLGARDTLRLEAGLPLHGHELGPGISPLQAGLDWVVRWDKGDFTGRAALEVERDEGPTRRLHGLVVPGRRPPRAEQAVFRGSDSVGVVTSGNFSPMLEHGIALALLDAEVAQGEELEIDARGSRLAATSVALPFVARGAYAERLS